MATVDAAKQAMGTLNAIQTLVENFPMNFLNKGKTYTSVIDFALDVLYALGINEEAIITFLLGKIFNVPNIDEVTSKISSKVTAVSEAMYEKVSEIEVESDFLNALEDAIKLTVGEILTGILSCSAIPEIPNWDTDEFGKQDKKFYGTLSIPISSIDLFGRLSIPPAHKIGGNFYDIKDLQFDRIEGYTIDGKEVKSKTVYVNDLYKTTDMNAFLWYVMNRGTAEIQKEKNKMMWDSRRTAKKELKEAYNRNTDDQWNYWLNSKENPQDYFIMSGDTLPTKHEDCRDFKDYSLFPIIQLQPDNELTTQPRLKVSLSSQRYFRKDTFNKSIYEFNWDYLRSIKMFSSRVLLADMLATLLNGSLLKGLNIGLTIDQEYAEARINAFIEKVFETDDLDVEDCYYNFSNEDYNAMLADTNAKRYNAKQLTDIAGSGVYYDIDNVMKSINDINTAATQIEYFNAIKKTVNQVALSGTTGNQSAKFGATVDWQAWLKNILKALVMPLVKQVLSPKVMLLFIINFQISGLINLDEFIKDGSFDTKTLLDLLLKKLESLLISIIRYIIEKVTMLLLKLFMEYVKPLLIEFSAIILLEALNDWIRWLNEALKCIPNFKLSSSNATNVLDDVMYADIEPVLNKPETEKIC